MKVKHIVNKAVFHFELSNMQVKTKIGLKFFTLLNKHFLVNSVFDKFFNKNQIKISYRAMANIEKIKEYNQKVFNVKYKSKTETCNCRKS